MLGQHSHFTKWEMESVHLMPPSLYKHSDVLVVAMDSRDPEQATKRSLVQEEMAQGLG